MSTAFDEEDFQATLRAQFEALSRREREVLDFVIAGSSNDEIGRVLRPQISVKTVETHRARINKKLEIHSTHEAVRVCFLAGVLRANKGKVEIDWEGIPLREPTNGR